MRLLAAALAATLLALAAAAGPGSAAPVPGARSCPLFPALVRAQPAGRPAARGRELRPHRRLDRARPRRCTRTSARAPGRAGRSGSPTTSSAARTPRSRVRFEYADESDRVRYPIPRRRPHRGRPDADGDRHALLLDRDACRLYELFALQRRARRAGPPARAPRGTCARRACAPPAGPRPTPPACRSCRCWPATTRSAAGRIDHALRVTVRRTRRAYVLPGAPLRLRQRRPVAAADGRAAAAEGGRRRLRPAAPGPRRGARDAALRPDRGRQRVRLVRLRRPAPALGQRPAARPRAASRGRDFEVVDASSLRRSASGTASTRIETERLRFGIALPYGRAHAYKTEQSRFGTTRRECRRCGRRAGPPPLVDARGPVPLADRHQPRQHDPQRRAADARARPGRLLLAAPVDRRLLHARLRRPAAHRRRARRPLRPQAAH